MTDGKDNDFENLDDFDLDSDVQDDTDIGFPSVESIDDAKPALDEAELEKYGVWVKVKPETVEDTLEEFQASDLAGLDSAETTLTEEEEQLLSELEEETLDEEVGLSEEEISGLEQEPGLDEGEEEIGELGTMPSALDDMGDIESDDQMEIELGEELPELTVQGEGGSDEIEVPLSEDISIEEDFSAFTDEEEAAAGEGRTGQTADVLAKIEQELLDIKNELAALKSELSHLQRPAGEEVEVKPVEEESKGFFNEEEDETIALTGDELDNILNTADITEEVADEDEFEGVLDTEGEPTLDSLDETELEHPGLGEEIALESLEESLDAEISLEELSAEQEAEEISLDLGTEEAAADISLELPDEEEISLEALEESGEEEELEILEEPSTDEEIVLEGLEEPAEEEDIDLERMEETSEGEVSLEDMISEAEELAGEGEEAQDVTFELTEEDTAEDISLELPEGEEISLEALGESAGEEEELEILEESSEEPTELEDIALEGLEETSEGEVSLEDMVSEVEELAEEEEDAEAAILEEEIPEVEALDDEELGILEEVQDEEPGDEEIVAEMEESGDEEAAEIELVADEEAPADDSIAPGIKNDIKTVLSYMDQLLESLPEDKIEEFAKSEYFDVYKKLFEELGIAP